MTPRPVRAGILLHKGRGAALEFAIADARGAMLASQVPLLEQVIALDAARAA